MSTASTAPPTAATPTAPAPETVELPPPPRYRPWLLVIAVIAALAVVAVVFVPAEDVEGQALQRMTPAVRSELYQVTRRNAEVLCERAEVQRAFRKRCIGAASFLLEFPDCDAGCRAFAHRFVGEPTR